MKRFVKPLKALVVIVLLSCIFLFATAASAPEPSPVATSSASVAHDKVSVDSNGSATVTAPDWLVTWGPIATFFSLMSGGILLIIKAINEGKNIDVATAQKRADKAEDKADDEIARVYRKLEAMEAKLDAVIAERDADRDEFAKRKTHFMDELVKMEKRHQAEIEDAHSTLMVEIHTRRDLEKILALNGIDYPKQPPPYTQTMKDNVTMKDARDAAKALE